MARVRKTKAGRYGLAMLINKYGKWSGPRRADGTPNFSIIDDLIRAKPKYLRITRAPFEERAIMAPRDPAVRAQLDRLRASGIKLGTAINSAQRMSGGRQKTVREVVRHARRIQSASPGLYDHVYLDFFGHRKGGQQKIANRIRRQVGMQVITNDSGATRPAPKRTWGHAMGFDLWRTHKKDWREHARKVASNKAPLITRADKRWIRQTKRESPGSTPQLHLSYPLQTLYQMKRLSRPTQRKLLGRMVRNQKRHGYKLWYPLYAPGMSQNWRGKGPSGPYDARKQGTYRLQKRGLAKYR